VRKVVVNSSLTLDGVMQAPGRPDRDPTTGVVIATYQPLEARAEETTRGLSCLAAPAAFRPSHPDLPSGRVDPSALPRLSC
jgi:hypothetical protein